MTIWFTTLYFWIGVGAFRMAQTFGDFRKASPIIIIVFWPILLLITAFTTHND